MNSTHREKEGTSFVYKLLKTGHLSQEVTGRAPVPADGPARRPPIVGCIGRAAVDYEFDDVALRVTDSGAWLKSPRGIFQLNNDAPIIPGAKVVVDLPNTLWLAPNRNRLGGGGVNFCRAMNRIAPDLSRRYVDCCAPDRQLVEALAAVGTELKCLGQFAVPMNAVFPHCADNVILKSRIPRPAPVDLAQRCALTWLAKSTVVVAQSLSDPEVVEQLAWECGKNKAAFFAAVTKSLPAECITGTLLPSAAAVFCSLSEISGPGKSLTEAVEVALWLLEHAKNSRVFVTLGKHGVLLVEPGMPAASHVALRPELADLVDAIVASDGRRACGCGDAYSAGCTAHLAVGRTLVNGPAGSLSTTVLAALEGSAAALRWLGFNRTISINDFDVTQLPVRKFFALAGANATSDLAGELVVS